MHKLMVGFAHFEVFVHFGERGRFQHLKYQNGMVGRQRASALRYDIRMRDTIFIAHVYQRRDRVVYILLNGIVYATFAIG